MKTVINLKIPRSDYFERTNTLVRYYDDIRKYKLLTQEEENKLFEIIENGDKFDKEKAKKTLINSNQRFVVAVAKRFATNDNILDLISEGNIGLIDAINDFDASKGYRFITFAVWYIRRAINNYCINYGVIVKKNNLSKTYHLVSQVTNNFIQKEFRQPTKEELMDILNNEYDLNIKNVGDILDTRITYIDESIEDEDDSQSFGEMSLFNSYSSSLNNSEINEAKDFNHKLITSMLKNISSRDAEVIKMSYGIGYDREYEIQEIARKLNLTKERVRQLKISVVNKLKELYKKELKKL